MRYDYAGLGDDNLIERGMDSEVRSLTAMHASGAVTFMNLPDIDTTEIIGAAEWIRERFDSLVVLGIGGSSLGARAGISALTRPYSGAPRAGGAPSPTRVYFVENVDPVTLEDLLAGLDPSRTALNVISKSGGTIETMSTFLIALRWLEAAVGEEEARKRVIATTDPEAGALRQLATEAGYRDLSVPPGVGGRFSVLSAVGLLPMAVAGLDIAAMLRGAAAIRDETLAEGANSAAGIFATHQLRLIERGRGDIVLMPYADALEDLAAWFVQLWAESLGKARDDGSAVGPVPIAAVGARDQHSLLQLLMEGPDTRNVLFVSVEREDRGPTVPEVPAALTKLRHLRNRRLGEIRDAELAGVRAGLARHQRATATLALEQLDAESVGALFLFFEAAVALVGFGLRINPFDQPGVELGKQYAHGILGSPQYVELAVELEKGADVAARSHNVKIVRK